LAGHLARMDGTRGVHPVLVGKPEGKRPIFTVLLTLYATFTFVFLNISVSVLMLLLKNVKLDHNLLVGWGRLTLGLGSCDIIKVVTVVVSYFLDEFGFFIEFSLEKGILRNLFTRKLFVRVGMDYYV
jgi:hypothetical protein